jgi:hypothetical protein
LRHIRNGRVTISIDSFGTASSSDNQKWALDCVHRVPLESVLVRFVPWERRAAPQQ